MSEDLIKKVNKIKDSKADILDSSDKINIKDEVGSKKITKRKIIDNLNKIEFESYSGESKR